MNVLECQAVGTPVVTTSFLAMKDYTKLGIAVAPRQVYKGVVAGWSCSGGGGGGDDDGGEDNKEVVLKIASVVVLLLLLFSMMLVKFTCTLATHPPLPPCTTYPSSPCTAATTTTTTASATTKAVLQLWRGQRDGDARRARGGGCAGVSVRGGKSWWWLRGAPKTRG